MQRFYVHRAGGRCGILKGSEVEEVVRSVYGLIRFIEVVGVIKEVQSFERFQRSWEVKVG